MPNINNVNANLLNTGNTQTNSSTNVSSTSNADSNQTSEQQSASGLTPGQDPSTATVDSSTTETTTDGTNDDRGFTQDDIQEAIVGDSIGDVPVSIQIRSTPNTSTVYVNDSQLEVKPNTPTIFTTSKKSLLQPTKVTIKKDGFISNEVYQVRIDSSVKGLPIIVDKFDLVGNRIPFTVDTSGNSFQLPFDLTAISIEPLRVVTRTDVQVDGGQTDVVQYVINNDDVGTVNGEESFTFLNRNTPLKLYEANSSKYKITGFELWIRNEDTDELTTRLDSTSGTELVLDSDKNYTVKVLWETVVTSNPVLTVNTDNRTFNILDETTLKIDYSTSDVSEVKFKLKDIERTLGPSGVIELTTNELNTEGNFTLYLSPFSSDGIPGTVREIPISVVSAAPQVNQELKLDVPTVLTGTPFNEYDLDFDVSFDSPNSDTVTVFIGSTDDELALGKYDKKKTVTFNVDTLYKKYTEQFEGTEKELTFSLVFRSEVKSFNEVQLGEEERVTITFTSNDLQIPKVKAVEDIAEAISKTLDETVFSDATGELLNHIAHFGDGDNKLITTWGIDNTTFTDFTLDELGNEVPTDGITNSSLVLKLYEPLPKNIEPNQLIWISKLQSIPLIEQVTIVTDGGEVCTPLKGPNFSLEADEGIGYQIYEDLIAVSSSTSTELVDTFVSESGINTRNLDIEYDSGSYYNFTEFVHYSSAEERARNFYYKMQLIESYDTRVNELSSGSDWTGSISVVNEANKYTSLKRGVINDFDGYEYFLYNETGSLSYPKSGSINLSYSASTVTDWFDALISDSQEYDEFNQNYLVNNIPQYIKEEEENEDYRLFLTMIGQHFDIIWTYINVLNRNKKLETKRSNGITDDMIYHVLQSFGWDSKTAYKSQYLWQYAFGTDKDGNVLTTSSGKELQSEVWRRILNNLPYLLKHKGTRRALYAVMSCYGVPQSMLTIMEFGGPQDPTQGGTTNFTFDDRTAALNFTGTEYMEVPWQTDSVSLEYPSTVELSFKTTTKTNHTLVDGDGWDLSIVKDTGSLGYLEFSMSSSGAVTSSITDTFPIYNDEYTQVAIVKTVSGSDATFTVYAKEGFQERIRQDVSTSITFNTGSYGWESGSELRFGNGFVGSMDEIRLWDDSLSESVINNHTLMPDAIDGNHVSASTEDLLLRLDFELPKDLNTTPLVKNVAIKTSYGVNDVSASGFTSNSTYPYQYEPYERTVTAKVPSSGVNVGNKFRFESQTLVTELDYKSRATKKSFDRAPVDTNRLGLFFSPVRELNLDIIRGLGDFNIDNYIGNFADEYNDTYSELDLLRKYVFERYDLNFYEYLRLIKYIDKSLFETLESLVPARAKVSKGILLEPHMLQRSKVRWDKPTSLRNDFSGEYSVNDEVDTIFTQETKEAELQTTSSYEALMFRDDIETTIENEDFTSLISDRNDFTASIDNQDTTNLTSEDLQYTSSVDAGLDEPTILAAIDLEDSYQEIGMEPDSIENALFGIYASGSHTLRTYRDNNNNYIHERQRVFIIKESYTIDIPKLITPFDTAGGTEIETVTRFRYRVTFLDYDATPPLVGTRSLTGTIEEVTPLNGIADSHYKYVGDAPTGLQRSFSEGSKNSISTSVDGQSPIQSIITNPNTLRVSDTDRGNGSPILEVD